MGSLSTGSNKLLEIQSGETYVVIKSKNSHPDLTNPDILQQPSELRVAGMNVRSVKIRGEEHIAEGSGAVGASFYGFHTSALFFAQTDYEIIVRSTDGKSVSLWHENYRVRNNVGPVTDAEDLISGIVNFGNSTGFSEFEISHDGNKRLVVRIEVFPSKISYKEDYQDMLQDISNEISGAVLDFMRNTYQEFSIGGSQNTAPALFFDIIQRTFDKFQTAANTIVSSPHHKLYAEHPIVPVRKVKQIDNQAIKWLHQHIIPLASGFSAVKALIIKKQTTYNTIENQFTKFILQSTVKQLKDFQDRYTRSARKPEPAILDRIDSMTAVLNSHINHSFLRKLDAYQATQNMSLVFEMAPAYRDLYKYYLMMQRGLSVHSDAFSMSLKDTAQFYEFWCFIKLVTMMKRNYHLAYSDVIKIDDTGVTISLVKGKQSEVKFINPRTGETITLAYNPGEQNTQTINQKPDNALTLEQPGTDVPYTYVFDAKYRYRDSIVRDNADTSRFMFEKNIFGAHEHFPDDAPNGEFTDHRFYNRIETVHIGGLPFLPGTTELVESLLAELVADSSASAFQHTSLPRGMEEKLAKVDWSVKDVMVGTVRTAEQLQFNLEKNGYYVPARYISDQQLPIKYIALHEDDLGDTSGIKRYGEVLTAQKIKRGRIPVTMRPGANPEELYYYFTVRKWMDLPHAIEIRDSFKGKPQFTNKFLLDHCTKSYQLFAISSKEEYRLMVEISKAFNNFSASTSGDGNAVHRVNNTHSVILDERFFTVTNNDGNIIERIGINSFAKSPRAAFNKIKKLVK